MSRLKTQKMGRSFSDQESAATPTEPLDKESIMTQNTLKPGDRVVHEATGERGILTSTNGVSAVVQWDSTGGKNPADILPVTDLEPAHDGIEAFTDAEIEDEITRRGMDAPAGFASELFMDCASEFGDACEPFGECDHGREYLFIGPEHYDNVTGWGVTTQWTPKRGIFHMVFHSGDGTWTPEELDALTEATATIKREIGLAAALVHVRKNPHLLSDKVTVRELASESVKIGLFASDIMHAVVTLREEDAK